MDQVLHAPASSALAAAGQQLRREALGSPPGPEAEIDRVDRVLAVPKNQGLQTNQLQVVVEVPLLRCRDECQTT